MDVDRDLNVLGALLPKGSVLALVGAGSVRRHAVGGIEIVPLDDVEWWTVVPALERLGREHGAD